MPASVRTKSVKPLFTSRELVTTLIQNDTEDNIRNYATSIDPAVLAMKGNEAPAAQQLRVMEIDGDQSPTWVSRYATGVNAAEVVFKRAITSGGVVRFEIGDSYSDDDLGAVLVPREIARKAIVTDLSNIECEIVNGASFDPVALPPGVDFTGQAVLYPNSSRHILKDSDGVIHTLTNFIIDGLLRVVYLVSDDGGVSWTAELVDNGDGMDYVTPSLTLDRDGGVHLVYCRYDKFTSYFYGLWDGADTPAGWELLSGAGGLCENKVLAGWETSGPFGEDSHAHDYSGWQNFVDNGCYKSEINADDHSSYDGATGVSNHSDYTVTIGTANHIPPYRSLKLIRWPGIPPSLPSGLIMPFAAAAPAGWTRYSAQDGYYVRCMATAGLTGGASTHTNYCSGTFSGSHGGCLSYHGGHVGSFICSHTHTWAGDSESANHLPPSYGLIFGKLDALSTTIPTNMLCMFGQNPGISGFTSLSGIGEALNQRAFVGYGSVADLGGAATHYHDEKAFQTTNAGAGHDVVNNYILIPWRATTCHVHQAHIGLYARTNWPATVALCIYRADQDINTATFGRDVYYRYKPKGGSWSSPVNISQMYSAFHSIYPTILADSSDNLHVMWAQGNLNTTPANKRICYRKQTAGVWGGRTEVTTADMDYHYPSFDISSDGKVHSVFFDRNGFNHLQYSQSTNYHIMKRTPITYHIMKRVLVSGNTYHILADDEYNVGYTKYWIAYSGGGGELHCDSTNPGDHEQFTFVDLGGGNIALRTFDGSHYVHAQGSGMYQLDATADSVGATETFGFVDLGDGYFMLVASNSKYVVNWTGSIYAYLPAEDINGYHIQSVDGHYWQAANAGGSTLACIGTVDGFWETFVFVDQGNGVVRIRAANAVHYVCAENAGASILNATRTELGAWENFKFVDLGDGYFTLIAVNNDYVTALGGGNGNLQAVPTVFGAIETIDGSNYCGWPGNVVVDSLGRVHITYAKFSDLGTRISEVIYRVRSAAGVWSDAINLTLGKEAAGYKQTAGQISLDNKNGLLVSFSGKGYGSYPDKFHPAFRYIDPSGAISPATGSDPEVLFDDENEDIVNPSLFWHLYPKITGVYQNLSVAGLTMLYLKNVRGASQETADICFFSSENALVGDAAPHGKGGSGSGGVLNDIGAIGGVGGESVLNQVSYRTAIRGAICKSKINAPNMIGSSLY